MSGKEYTTELLKLEDAQIERMEETEEESWTSLFMYSFSSISPMRCGAISEPLTG